MKCVSFHMEIVQNSRGANVLSEEVYVVCRQIESRNIVSGVFWDRADAVEDAKTTIQKMTDGDYESYTVDSLYGGNTDIEVYDGGNWRCIVLPFVLE